ncbi:MAG TPA: nuclease [Beutenbergiaceae bacterium]|nr:nuclease [Beutenbergiaceae bacterium]
MVRPTYVLVDGENIDATLGLSVLGHRPSPDERPRWDRITEFAARLWNQDVRALFFLNASTGQMPMSFVQALLALDYHPIPLSGPKDVPVVDVGIQKTLEALDGRPGDILLASHDGDFVDQVEALLGTDRRVGVLCFREFVSAKLSELAEQGLRMYDLEDDVRAFNAPLPRVRIIDLASFDPTRYL